MGKQEKRIKPSNVENKSYFENKQFKNNCENYQRTMRYYNSI